MAGFYNHIWYKLIGEEGIPIPSGSVWIYDYDSPLTQLNLFNSSGGQLSQPLTTDSNGVFEFYVKDNFLSPSGGYVWNKKFIISWSKDDQSGIIRGDQLFGEFETANISGNSTIINKTISNYIGYTLEYHVDLMFGLAHECGSSSSSSSSSSSESSSSSSSSESSSSSSESLSSSSSSSESVPSGAYLFGENTTDFFATTEDATLIQGAPTFNTGATEIFQLGHIGAFSRPVIKFPDLDTFLQAMIVSSSDIGSAKLYINYRDVDATRTVEIYKLRRLFNEGTKDFGAAATGEVTWNSARHNQLNWTTGGAGDTTNDRYATATDSVVVSATGWNSFDVTQDIKDMFDSLWTNYGWILLHNPELGSAINDIHSSESDSALRARPYIKITFPSGYTPLSSSISSSSSSSA